MLNKLELIAPNPLLLAETLYQFKQTIMKTYYQLCVRDTYNVYERNTLGNFIEVTKERIVGITEPTTDYKLVEELMLRYSEAGKNRIAVREVNSKAINRKKTKFSTKEVVSSTSKSGATRERTKLTFDNTAKQKFEQWYAEHAAELTQTIFDITDNWTITYPKKIDEGSTITSFVRFGDLFIRELTCAYTIEELTTHLDKVQAEYDDLLHKVNAL